MIYILGKYPQTVSTSIQAIFPRLVFSTLTMCLFVSLLAVLTQSNVSHAQAETQINCPTDNNTPFPEYAELSEPPNIAYWSMLPSLPEPCSVSLERPAKLTIALAGTFTHTGSVEDIATRLGAISKTRGLLYWSVTDKKWNTLISKAVALNSQDKKDTRPDFSGQEVLSGQTLVFAQDDTRTWGFNLFTGKVLDTSPEHLVFASHNSSPIKVGPMTIFKPEDAQSVLFVNRLTSNTWSAYSLSVIKRSGLPTRKESLISRQIAFYRLVTGQKPDGESPILQ